MKLNSIRKGLSYLVHCSYYTKSWEDFFCVYLLIEMRGRQTLLLETGPLPWKCKGTLRTIYKHKENNIGRLSPNMPSYKEIEIYIKQALTN